MKPKFQRKSLPNHRDTGTPAHRTAEASAHTPKSLASHHRRHNGNVARLPKLLRDKVNTMLLDGVTYPALIKNLGADGKGLIPSNLSRWKNGGHQDWLAEQAFIARVRARQETPSDLTRDYDGTEVGHAALQLGTLHVFEALRELGPGSLNEKLGGDCAAFARLLNALSRASRETMLLQKFRDACARARAALQPLQDPNRKISEKETRAVVRHVDAILGLQSIDEKECQTAEGRDAVERVPTGE